MLLSEKSCTFVLSSNKPKLVRKGNIIFLPANSGFHYPDIVRASDVVKSRYGARRVLVSEYPTLVAIVMISGNLKNSRLCKTTPFSESITLKELENGSWLTEQWISNPVENMVKLVIEEVVRNLPLRK